MESSNTQTQYESDTPEEAITGDILTCPACSGSKIAYINGDAQTCSSCHGRGTVDNPTPTRIRMLRQERMQERSSRVWSEGAAGVHEFEGDTESCERCGHPLTNSQHLQEAAATDDVPEWKTTMNVFGDEESNEPEVTRAVQEWIRAPHLDWFIAYEDRADAVTAAVAATKSGQPRLESIEPWLRARSQDAQPNVQNLIRSADQGRPSPMQGGNSQGIFMGMDINGANWDDWENGIRPAQTQPRKDFQTPERVLMWQHARELIELPRMRAEMAAAESGIPLALIRGLPALNRRFEFNAQIISDLKAKGYEGAALVHEVQRYAQKPG